MISIFKTNIQSGIELNNISHHLNTLLSGATWSVDLSDSDKILRIDSSLDKISDAVSLLTKFGYNCENLQNFYAPPVW
ncbi:hypothetical protein EV200_106257 [Pedobacter psychrotolerans]|uniref:HMA domain-containing protein n=1 Tax=Pedobacter psychrotolerans TaxID=1843235 RepID=A0A4R2H851_9SPHI|nr:hypothetical protein [Pedobacter psychrotolerans]TCO22614.1 hypothetical protein EV200_106257 [Pedobacter psychrotolerans]GGE65852.1 hypothetical protein GCM10011413_35480 [Pedobacter psychrotolerans]